MMERRQIVRLWSECPDGVLATIVRITGSAYRRPGAHQFIIPTTCAGTIAGGCLDMEVLRKAAWIVRDGSTVERFSTQFDDTAEVPYGNGCGGTLDVLFESTDAAETHALLQALEASLHGDASRVITWLPTTNSKLRRAIFNASNDAVFASEDLPTPEIVMARSLSPDADIDGLYIEQLVPPQRLIIFGAGDDARTLVNMATLLGWTVVVADGRAQFATRDRFPQAEEVVTLLPDQTLPLRAEDAVVLMTHSYEQDRHLLTAILPQPTRYLGLLGARHRTSILLSEAAVLTGRSLEECCARIYAPVGLDLGGDGPEAIALAILAQIHAVIEGRNAGQRRLTTADIAEQLGRGGVSRMLREQHP